MDTNKMSDHFSLEITTTALCNLGCTYCFEGVKTDKTRLDDKVDYIKKRIYELLETEWFKTNYRTLTLSFWGGEPTLNNKLIIDLIHEFQDVQQVGFHLYTNGYNRKRLDDVIDAVKDLEKLNVQISYDGEDTSNKFRITHSGKGSASQVLENIEYFARRNIRLSLKSTIPLKAMDSLYDTWMEFKRMHKYLNGVGRVNVSYAPTIDYVDQVPTEKLDELIATFRQQMLKVAKEEIKFYKEHGYHLCTWFDGGDVKTHCSSGAHMHAINVDGNGYACHGSFYSPNKEEMKGASVMDDNFIPEMIKMTDMYKEPLERISDTCKGCVATTCMICPVTSLDLSKKETFFERWQDRWVNNMCGFFKAFGEIDRTVQAYLHDEIKTVVKETKETVEEY